MFRALEIGRKIVVGKSGQDTHTHPSLIMQVIIPEWPCVSSGTCCLYLSREMAYNGFLVLAQNTPHPDNVGVKCRHLVTVDAIESEVLLSWCLHVLVAGSPAFRGPRK